jgi:predicted phage-related endonuclease
LGDLEGGFISSEDEKCGIAPSPWTNQPPASPDPEDSVQWPRLEHLQLSASDVLRRSRGIGGSDANIILSGDAERIHQLWLEKRGESEPADLSNVLPVILGCWTEPFNRQWFEHLTATRISNVGAIFTCRVHEWRRCTLDGIIQDTGSIFEAKHTSAFAKADEILERYMPQLQHDMAVTGYRQATLSVLFGNHKFEIFEVAADWLYQIELLEAEQRFWNCVLTGEEPVPAKPPPPPRPIGTREVCLEGNNSWASAAFDWLKHRDAAKAHACACASIKSLVEEDVSRAFGHGIEAKRSKSGAITIKELAP